MFDTIWPTIISWGKGKSPSAVQYEQVINWLLAPDRADVWQLDASSVGSALGDRIRLLQSIVQKLQLEQSELPLPGDWTTWIEPMWRLWLPLALKIDRAQRIKVPSTRTPLYVQGMLGGQGTGKTTLSRILQLLLRELGQQVARLSLDDLYLTYAERCELREKDLRFVWRGPPGTHDVDLGVRTFARIVDALPGDQVQLPRFDKSLYGGQGDRSEPELMSRPTIVLFEGWCVGAQPLPDDAFTELRRLPAPINTEADRVFAYDCNRRLRTYLPLWDYLDSLVVLSLEDYRLSLQWRQQAERAMMAEGKDGLSDEEIATFVTYFWQALHPQLFVEPMTRVNSSSGKVDLVATIHQHHQLGRLFVPCSDSYS